MSASDVLDLFAVRLAREGVFFGDMVAKEFTIPDALATGTFEFAHGRLPLACPRLACCWRCQQEKTPEGKRNT